MSYREPQRLAIVFSALGAVLLTWQAAATHPCTSPLVLDLDGDRILWTTGEEYPVEFDIDTDGHKNTISWTGFDTNDAFLYLDLDLNGRVDDGGELFGTGTLLPDGSFADNGFDALAVHDKAAFGGDEDGRISPADRIWRDLRLWLDKNHDAVTQPEETQSLDEAGVLSIDLEYEGTFQHDGHGNLKAYQGTFIRRVNQYGVAFRSRQTVWDIFFLNLDGAERHRPH